MKLRLHTTFFLCIVFFLFNFSALSQDTKQCDDYIQAGIKAMFDRDYIQAFDNLGKAQAIVNKTKWYKQQFLIYNNLGLIYYKMQDYSEAVNHFVKAYELAVSEKQPGDEMTVLNNIAIVYAKNDNKPQAKEYLYKSYQIAQANDNLSKQAIYAANLAFLNYELKNYPESQRFIDKALAIPEEEMNERTYLNLTVVKNLLQLQRGYIEQVIKESHEQLEICNQKNFVEEKIEVLILLAKAYKEQKNWKESLRLLDEALDLSNNYETKVRIYETKSEIEIAANMYPEALVSKDSVIVLNQKISSTQNKELLENATLRFELTESKFALQANEAAAQNQKKFYLLSLLSLVLVSVILGVIFYKRNTLAQQNRIIAENTLKIKNLELEQEKNKLILLEKEAKEKELLADLKIKKQKEKELSLKKEIELKNKQLSDKILFQSTRNKMLEEIIETITSRAEFKENQVLSGIVKELKNHLKEDSKWDDYSELFENVNNTFIKNIKQKHPILNANDIRFISFIYLNLNIKEIASLLNISPESCRKRKERLRHKLGIDKELDLYEYLTSFA